MRYLYYMKELWRENRNYTRRWQCQKGLVKIGFGKFEDTLGVPEKGAYNMPKACPYNGGGG